MTNFPNFRSSKPGNLISITKCKAFGLRIQVEFKGKKQVKWALDEIGNTPLAIALMDHNGNMVATSSTWA